MAGPPVDGPDGGELRHGGRPRRPRAGAGYEHVSNGAELAAATSPKLLGLFANEEMFEHRNEGEGAIYQPSVPLRDMASKALDTLSADEDGFFLLIEEEGIDEMAHHNNAHLTIAAGAAFDATVALVLDFVKAHPDTLVVVEGDHETGGLTIENVDPDDESGEADSREDGPSPSPGRSCSSPSTGRPPSTPGRRRP